LGGLQRNLVGRAILEDPLIFQAHLDSADSLGFLSVGDAARCLGVVVGAWSGVERCRDCKLAAMVAIAVKARRQMHKKIGAEVVVEEGPTKRRSISEVAATGDVQGGRKGAEEIWAVLKRVERRLDSKLAMTLVKEKKKSCRRFGAAKGGGRKVTTATVRASIARAIVGGGRKGGDGVVDAEVCPDLFQREGTSFRRKSDNSLGLFWLSHRTLSMGFNKKVGRFGSALACTMMITGREGIEDADHWSQSGV
jgi:hypothetical protein